MTFLIPKNEFRKPNFAIFFFTTFLWIFHEFFVWRLIQYSSKSTNMTKMMNSKKIKKKFREIKKNFFREIEISWLLGKFQPHTSNHVTYFPL